MIIIADRQPRRPANLCGRRIRILRQFLKLSEGALATRLQSFGVDLDYVAVGRFENSQRRVSDIELLGFASALELTSIDALVKGEGALTLEEYALLAASADQGST